MRVRREHQPASVDDCKRGKLANLWSDGPVQQPHEQCHAAVGVDHRDILSWTHITQPMCQRLRIVTMVRANDGMKHMSSHGSLTYGADRRRDSLSAQNVADRR